MELQQIQDLLGAIADTDITEFTLKQADFELTIRKEQKTVMVTAPETSFMAAPAMVSQPAVAPTVESTPADTGSTSSTPSRNKNWVEITSPMVGTFYSAPAPDESPFVEIGDRVSKGQTVCIIEAMKLMNEIESEQSGKVVEITVENGEPVEYGQTLMWIDPS
jgi:acetyl-CoA carboxylase biotin carboxyl carrier protein